LLEQSLYLLRSLLLPIGAHSAEWGRALAGLLRVGVLSIPAVLAGGGKVELPGSAAEAADAAEAAKHQRGHVTFRPQAARTAVALEVLGSTQWLQVTVGCSVAVTLIRSVELGGSFRVHGTVLSVDRVRATAAIRIVRNVAQPGPVGLVVGKVPLRQLRVLPLVPPPPLAQIFSRSTATTTTATPLARASEALAAAIVPGCGGGGGGIHVQQRLLRLRLVERAVGVVEALLREQTGRDCLDVPPLLLARLVRLSKVRI
jgi:hypothetical protein